MMGGGKDSPTRLARLGRLTNDPKSADARVFVGNISSNTITDLELRDLFSHYGDISGVSMHNQGTYAFVQFANEAQAQRAIHSAAGQVLAGKRIGEFLHFFCAAFCSVGLGLGDFAPFCGTQFLCPFGGIFCFSFFRFLPRP